MIHLKSIKLVSEANQTYPYNLPIFNNEIVFKSPITIIIGDNGCGKSTLLELIRHKLNLFQIGKPINFVNRIKSDVQLGLKKPKGFYFSSEDFTTYIYELENEKRLSESALNEVKENYKNKSEFAKNQAASPHKKTLHEIDQLHDKDLSKSSHGEAYLSFFKSRLRPKQLILLDEPETPLSFENQLALMYLIKEGIDMGSQFIIATHSPIIMAFPNANIYQFTDKYLEVVEYNSVNQVRNLKSFLQDPERFFNQLFKP